MRQYRIYLLDRKGRLAGVPASLEAENDVEALAAAAHCTRPGESVEVWEKGRLVGQVSLGGTNPD